MIDLVGCLIAAIYCSIVIALIVRWIFFALWRPGHGRWLRCPVCGDWFREGLRGLDTYMDHDGRELLLCAGLDCQYFAWRRRTVHDDIRPPTDGAVVELADLRQWLSDVAPAAVTFTAEGGYVETQPRETGQAKV